MTGHGNVKFREEEIRSLRRYLDMGGFLWADDCFGMDKSFREQMRLLYPETPLVELPFTHPLFRNPYPFPEGRPQDSRARWRPGPRVRDRAKRTGRGPLHVRL